MELKTHLPHHRMVPRSRSFHEFADHGLVKQVAGEQSLHTLLVPLTVHKRITHCRLFDLSKTAQEDIESLVDRHVKPGVRVSVVMDDGERGA